MIILETFRAIILATVSVAELFFVIYFLPDISSTRVQCAKIQNAEFINSVNFKLCSLQNYWRLLLLFSVSPPTTTV